MTTLLKYLSPLSLLTAPFLASAQTFSGTHIEENLQAVTDIVNFLITLLILLATFLFLWGIVKYITAGGDEEKIKEARGYIIWGIIFLAVMVAIWGFVNILLDFVFGSGNPSGSADNPTPIPLGPQQ
ncbi:MAG: hypothetical protein COU90_01510 [Candidatus Ryanbacteria bacterium CG10_big_fil_rev_8_21_14_0_10_43_42]|uniref:Uncharacterized protein n=1 Tax=Candidatus Ryanbacteria bacterium CG10_big_fil_rev_8_21_14_0_10_43_42 TaxID=1974864 RepID=A0A2M8KX48_9BACT|nr:MAG: hypothetical protein COU90_01510 [Candidatus Ryanbacteria bacterium CG10_big_fil_rev_8_21_14_0_10_43_42]